MTFRGTILVGSTLDYRVICKWPDVWTDQNYHTNDRPQYVTYIFPFRYIKILFARTISKSEQTVPHYWPAHVRQYVYVLRRIFREIHQIQNKFIANLR